MKTSLEINNQNIDFERNWFTGSFTYTTNGITKTLQSALDPLTHFSVNLSRTYKVQIEDTIIKVIKTRPLLLAGLRAHSYQFYINDKLIKEVKAL